MTGRRGPGDALANWVVLPGVLTVLGVAGGVVLVKVRAPRARGLAAGLSSPVWPFSSWCCSWFGHWSWCSQM
jgi:hypothetical protein